MNDEEREELVARIRELERQRNNALAELTVLAGRLAILEARLVLLMEKRDG